MANRKCTERIEAKIVRYEYHNPVENPSYYLMHYSYVYEWHTYQGKYEISTYMIKKVEQEHPVGSMISVYIDPKVPWESRMKPRGTVLDNVGPVVFTVFWLLLFGGAWWMMR